MAELLLTGFEGFLGRAKNPSWDTLAELRRRKPALFEPDGPVATERLPVIWRQSGILLRNAIELHKPKAVVCFGMHGGPDSGGRGSSTFYVERLAHNLDDSKAPDNAGEVRVGRKIDPEVSLEYLRATLDSDRLVRSIRNAGQVAEVSDDAGRYLCNHVFFCALNHRASYHPPPLIGFIHVPPGIELRHDSITQDQFCGAVLGVVEAILPGATRTARSVGSGRLQQ